MSLCFETKKIAVILIDNMIIWFVVQTFCIRVDMIKRKLQMQFTCLLEHGKWIGLLLLLIPMETMGLYLLKSLGLCSSNIAWSKICFWLVKFQCHYREGFKEQGSMKLSIPIG
jgi:hypothetical protein